MEGMDMRKIVSALVGVAMVFAVGLAAGCGPLPESSSSDEPESNVDFWGNPIAKDDNGDPACAVKSGAPVPPGGVPYVGGRPRDVRPGNSWIVFELTARALPPAPGGSGTGFEPYAFDYCVPIAVHVYTRPGEADTVQLDEVGFEAGPFDFTTTTPWTGRYVALQYDPTDERFAGRPPAYEVHLQVAYDQARDEGPMGDHSSVYSGDPTALACAIRIAGVGNAVAYDLAQIGQRNAVECVLRSNDGWHTY
jgi:hypothetical protein